MKCRPLWAMLAAVVLSSPALLGDGPRLVNEKLLLGPDESRDVDADMALLHGGGKLVFCKRQMGQVPKADETGTERGSVYRLWEIDLAGGTKRALPIPARMGSDPVELDDMLRLAVPSPDGVRMLLPSGVDANGDGIFDHRREKSQWVIYHADTGEVEPVKGLPEGFIWPQFDRTGKGLIVAVADQRARTVEVFARPLAGGKMTELAMGGAPLAICPAADLLVVVRNLGQPPLKPYMKQDIVLHDSKSGRWLPLPAHEQYAQTPIKRAAWTANGRYLYYADMKGRSPGEGRALRDERSITRVWDRAASKEAGLLDYAVPVGHGPGQSTMLLGKAFPYRPHVPAVPMLHDPAGGGLWALMDVPEPKEPNAPLPVRLCCARGKHILYFRTAADGKRGLYLAEIALPQPSAPAKAP